MTHYGALLNITKKKGALIETDNALFKKVLGILDMDEFLDLNGEEFQITFEAVPDTDNQYQVKLTSYKHDGNEELYKQAKDNDMELAKEVKDVLTSTLGDQFSFKVGFEAW